MHHPIRSGSRRKSSPRSHPVTPTAPQWPSYTGNSQFVGTSPSGRVAVYLDPTLGSPGLQNAQDLVNDADRVMTANDEIFGTVGGSVNVIVFAIGGKTDGTGGADHLACNFQDGSAIEICASFGNSARVSALFEAEVSECSMGGNLCGVSTGEALSRWCALVVGNNALADFATAPQWAQDGMPDFVDQTDPTDQNPDSTGCGMAFLSWLMSQGYGLAPVAQAMVALGDSGTLAQLYANLTSDSAANAWPNFQAAVQNLPNGVTSDDPFGAAAQPLQMGPPARLRVSSQGGIPATEVQELLRVFEHAYNCLLIFQAATDVSGAAKLNWSPDPYFGLEKSRSMVLPANRLVLSGAELGSPGFWEFLGSMNPLEIIRKYLQDRHERRKDLQYRNEQERREKEVEILLHVTELMEKRIELAKRAGAPPYIVASLFNELVGRPLAALADLQDRGLLITGIPELLTGRTPAVAKSG